MERWKSRGGKSQGGEDKRWRRSNREKVRREKIQVREKVRYELMWLLEWPTLIRVNMLIRDIYVYRLIEIVTYNDYSKKSGVTCDINRQGAELRSS